MPRFLFLPILLVALFLRVYRLEEIPQGVDYDESANLILVQEIAGGQTPPPIFVKAYAGREGMLYWLAALNVRLLGRPLFALRLTSALCGVLAIVYAYALAREMFRDGPTWVGEGVPLLATTLMSVSYWLVHVNRYGFRVNTMPPLMTATMFYLWRGLRQNRWTELAFAGLLCGLSANTYLAIRAFPLLLGFFAVWTIARWGKPFLRLRQWALVGICALIAFAPLGRFFIQNPEFFSIRMSQASIFDPEIHQGDLPGALAQATLKMLGDFTIRGDEDPIYNLPGKPILGPLAGLAFYVGLLICACRIFQTLKRLPVLYSRTPYFLLPVWLSVMMLPNILGARGIPHHLRGIGMSPSVFYLAALGIAGMIEAARRWLKKWSFRWATPTLCLIILATGAVTTWHEYAGVWANSSGAYYRGSASLRRAAEFLGGQNAEQVSLWVSNSSYRHTTYAANCANYAHLKWFSGQTLVLGADERPALYTFDFTNPLDPLLARYIPQDTLVYRDRGPDGGIGFEAYLITPDRRPQLRPQYPTEINLGHTLMLIGYDLNEEPVSGRSLDVTLYWRVLRAVDRDDFAFFVHLVDDPSFRWGGETFFNYPSLQWRAGETMLFRKRIAIAPGAPPGPYWLDVGVYSASLDARLPLLNEAGQLVGTSARIGPFEVTAGGRPKELPVIQRPIKVALGERLSLLGYDRDRDNLRPGETLALTLYWQAEGRLEQEGVVWVWLEGEGSRIELWRDHSVYGRYPFAQWQPDAFIRDGYALRLPLEVAAGEYRLFVGVAWGGGDPSAAVELGTLRVHAGDRLWEAPPFDHPVDARLGDQVRLLGYSLDRTRAAPGESIHLTLVWQCLKEMDIGYTVFTHLLDENEQMRGQKDNPPRNGSYPTTLWVAGEIIVDEYDITVKPDTPPGIYVIEVGMYNPANLQRLQVFDPMGALTDRILLGHITVK